MDLYAVVWTRCSSGPIKIDVSETVVKPLLKKHNLRQRKIQKRITMKAVANRNEQFEQIAKLKEQYQISGNPVISIDTKKKENLGNFYRDGHLYTAAEIASYDHDFKSFAEGVVISHGIYDLGLNKAIINIGTSSDTSEFACDSLREWWYQHGKND